MSSDRLSCFLPDKFKTVMAIAIAVGIGNSCPTLAQIAPDTSLGSENSVVTPEVEIKGETADRIDGGAIRDRNLFHSFDEFNIDAGQRVYFANPSNIEQIFTRVTGNNPSNINGTLGVDGAADLLLLNPNGIIFGENSSLDIEGSFFGTSAESVLFEDEKFSAVQPSSLLTISVPVGLQMGDNPGSIEVRSPLQVGSGQNFTLLGGDIDLQISETESDVPSDGITTQGGRIELGGLSNSGIVTFEDSSNLNFPSETLRGNIILKNFLIDAVGDGTSINIYSRNLRLVDSGIATGIAVEDESTGSRVGDITIDTQDATILEASSDGTSAIFSTTQDINRINGISAGNISLNTGSLSITGTSFIFSFTTGEGDAGNISINARQFVSLASEPNQRNDITSLSFANGNSANIQIKTPELYLNNADISTSTGGAGNAGNITIDANNSITVNNGRIEATTVGSGNGGDVLFISEAANINLQQAAIRTDVAIGEISLNDSSSVATGTGQGGNIVIRGRNLVARDSVSISSATEGEVADDGSLPNAGNMEINITDSITLDNNSVLQTASSGQGNAGNLTIDTGKLTARNSAISSGTNGFGRAGNINIFASESIDLDGNLDDYGNTSPEISPSSIFSSTFGDTDAGNIVIKTSSLAVNNGAQIQATTFSTGNAGNINIDADRVRLTGISEENFQSAILAITDRNGDGGIVNIKTNDLILQDRAAIGVLSIGEGDAGSIVALINNSLELNNGAITSRSDRSSGGEVDITAGDIRLGGDSNIRTSVENGAGGGGNITLSADSIVAFDDSDIFAFAADGVGGNITLDTDAFFAANYDSATLDANPLLLDDNNRVDLNASGSVFGVVDLPDVNFLPNNLVELPQDTIAADEVVANSCVVNNNKGGTFIVTGSDGLRSRPGDAAAIDYATGGVRTIPDEQSQTTTENWQPGSIIEPDRVYRLSNGKLILSRGCD